MVRTVANSSARKAVSAKAPRKQVCGSSSGGAACSSGASTSGSPNSGKNKYAGGNVAMSRPTPTWQKGIGQFFSSPSDNGDISAGEPSASNPEASGSSMQSSTSTANQ